MYYKECPFCGANLDPGEVCDCQEERSKTFGKSIYRNRTGNRRGDRGGRSVRLCAEKMSLRNTAR